MTEQLENERHLALNGPAVACQVIDGEAILIHFERGLYFSAAGSAAWILERLQRGLGAHEIHSALTAEFGVAPERARTLVARFLDELVVEKLFVPWTPDDTSAIPSASAPTLRSEALAELAGGPATEFSEPRLVKYSDLQDLLVLDPIHDVIVTGWPARPSGESTP